MINYRIGDDLTTSIEDDVRLLREHLRGQNQERAHLRVLLARWLDVAKYLQYGGSGQSGGNGTLVKDTQEALK